MPKRVESYPSASLSFIMLVSREKYFGTLSATSTWTVLKCICVYFRGMSSCYAWSLWEREESVVVSPLIARFSSLWYDPCGMIVVYVWRNCILSSAAISETSRMLTERSVLGYLREYFGTLSANDNVDRAVVLIGHVGLVLYSQGLRILAERRGLLLTLCPKLISYSFYTIR